MTETRVVPSSTAIYVFILINIFVITRLVVHARYNLEQSFISGTNGASELILIYTELEMSRERRLTGISNNILCAGVFFCVCAISLTVYYNRVLPMEWKLF